MYSYFGSYNNGSRNDTYVRENSDFLNDNLLASKIIFDQFSFDVMYFSIRYCFLDKKVKFVL